MHQLSKDLFRDAVDLNDTIVFEYDIINDTINFSDNLTKYIPISQNISGYVAGLNKHGRIHFDDIKAAISFFSSLKEPEKVRTEYVRFSDVNDDFRWYQIKGRIQNNDEDVPVKLIGTFTYMDDETKKRTEEAGHDRDDFTGLLKEEAFYELLNEYIRDIPKDVIPCLLLIDGDDYGEWVVSHGEANGEEAIYGISNILKRAFRSSDIIGKLDGDRFAVAMKGVRSISILLERAAYVRQSIKDLFFEAENGGGLTVSVGISAGDAENADADKLMARACDALSDAKHSGKDTYVLYSGESDRYDTSVNPILSTKEMELVRNLLDPLRTCAYAVDDNYRLLYRNKVMIDKFGTINDNPCYVQNKGYSEPCQDCPFRLMDDKHSYADCDVYSPSLKASVPMRVTRIILRNGHPIYVFTSTDVIDNPTNADEI